MPQESGISEGKIDYKVPGGKLIRMHVIYSGDVLREVRINGDFFLHPEEALEELEDSLKDRSMGEAEKIIRRFCRGVEMAGVSPEDFIRALKLAIK